MVVREGAALRKIGESADLFDDHTPLQLGASGKYQGAPFTLVGRLQYRYADGTWNEWHAVFDGAGGAAKSGWLSEDNGRYVFAFDAPLEGAGPAAESLRAGTRVLVAGQAWDVASVVSASLLAALGELPFAPPLGRGFTVSDLRNARGEVGTLDYSALPAGAGTGGAAPGGDQPAPRWSIGRSVTLAELALTGLADAAEKTLKGRAIACPNCGAALAVKLATTQSIVCHQCHAVVDVSQGVGADLRHYTQTNGLEPQIPLGRTGTLALGGAAAPWQVVGYVERCEVPGSNGDDNDNDGDEQTFWREYLLYHRTQGFAFLIDAQDGWSWSAPITGAPERFGDSVKYQGTLYRKLYDYTGMVTYVLGEFYWRLAREQRTRNTDYQGTGGAAQNRLNREQTGTPGAADAVSAAAQEVVWSAGVTLTAGAVMQAFNLAPEQRAALERDALPTSLGGAGRLAKIFFWGFVLVVVLMLFRCASGGGGGGSAAACDSTLATYGEASTEYRNCVANNRSSGGGYRTGGGSYGGFSTGGGHK